MPFRIALLIGKGSRVPGILKCVEGLPDAKVVFVLSSVGEGIGIETALAHGISGGIVRLENFGKTKGDRERFSATVVGMLRKHKVDLVLMAGWRIIMPKSFVEEFEFRIINIHPSILPAYPGNGEKAISRQWEEKATLAGCTLHFVDEGMDTGPIILQGFIDREDYQTIEEFEQAIHRKEDEVLCDGIKLIVA